MKSFTSGAVVPALGFVLTLAGMAQAQDALVPKGDAEVMGPGSNWGATNTVVTYEASDFELFFGSYGGYTSTWGRYCGSVPDCGWLVGIKLPAGAIMSSVELDACDSDVNDVLYIAVWKNVKGGGAPTNLSGWGDTGATPGCTTFVRALTVPETINNLNSNYWINVHSGATSSTSFKAVRVNYRLQVSPAPAVATFPNDVPTSHPVFRFVEAMAASGLTGGCGSGSFCPDSPVTRGQLAVFLASALGLHFPN